jgi:hypothetical protein
MVADAIQLVCIQRSLTLDQVRGDDFGCFIQTPMPMKNTLATGYDDA